MTAIHQNASFCCLTSSKHWLHGQSNSLSEADVKHVARSRVVWLFCALAMVWGRAHVRAADWTVPMAGNVFRTAPQPGGNSAQRNGSVAWSDAQSIYTVYFHIDRPADLRLAIQAAVRQGQSMFKVRVGTKSTSTVVTGTMPAVHRVGSFQVAQPGYVRVDFQGTARTGAVYADIQKLLISSDTKDLKVDFVKHNQGGMFYWGRRGPSVHLSYQLPSKVDLRYAYSEINVPSGQDPIGSFYMANGFGQGYFGIQVNSATERRVLFSVWSPFKTDNPRKIPPEQRIVALARGAKVHVGEFGNEGSGGQSYLVYPWKAGTTYRFLTKVEPDGQGNTVYTSWFGNKMLDEWQLIASFRRPKTDTHLRGFHSFLESFSPAHGYLGRRAFYGNVWVCDVKNRWHECTRARFTVDPTGGGRHRLDFTGGADGKHFFLRNCGFFNETGRAGTVFTRSATGMDRPDVDLTALPSR